MINNVVGILGYGEIGKAIAHICQDSGFKTLVRDLTYDEIKDNKIGYLHVCIPEKNQTNFIKIVVNSIKEFRPILTIVNSSTTPGTVKKIFKLTDANIVHSPVIGIHPDLYLSIKKYFVKVIGPVNNSSKKLATSHFKKLKLKYTLYNSSNDSEAAKILDLVYYAWNIIYCKWVKEMCDKNSLNFNQVYTLQNRIYNNGYKKLLPDVIRPVMFPVPGAIGGHCTIPDTEIFHKYSPSRLTAYILNENRSYMKREKVNKENERLKLHKVRKKRVVKC